jgi:hypothetical protein
MLAVQYMDGFFILGLVVMPPRSAGVQSATQQPKIIRQGNKFFSSHESLSLFSSKKSGFSEYWPLSLNYLLFK